MNREPWLAALLSASFPGAGHFYAGARVAGAVFLAIVLAVVAGTAWAFYAPAGPVSAGWAGIVLLLGLLVFAGFDAHRRCAREATPEFMAERIASGDAWKAVFFTALFPGLGQFYAGRALPGIAFFLAGLVTAAASEWPLVLAFVALRGGAMFDAWRGGVLRRGTPADTARTVVLGLTLLAAGQLSIAALVRAKVVQAFRIPSVSMAPTIAAGDHVFVDRTRSGRVEAGDMIAYRYPLNTALSYAHRCVAVGGQTIEIRDRVVLVDGRAIEEPYVTHADPNVRPGDEDARDNMPLFTVPHGQVFVMGDNRDNANDSRYWGPVPLRNILGRVYKVYWPLNRAGSLLGH